MTDEEIIEKGFKPFHGETIPADYDGGEVLVRATENIMGCRVVNEPDQWNWRGENCRALIIGYHPKKPNKIVIPDGPPAKWAVNRAKELFKYKRSDFWSGMGHLIQMLEEEPIDEDLIEARKIVAEKNHHGGMEDYVNGVRRGALDNGLEVGIALAAIKRGRELGKAGDQDHD